MKYAVLYILRRHLTLQYFFLKSTVGFLKVVKVVREPALEPNQELKKMKKWVLNLTEIQTETKIYLLKWMKLHALQRLITISFLDFSF